ncbi:hypothetical protein [Streptomyces sp. NPDC002845]
MLPTPRAQRPVIRNLAVAVTVVAAASLTVSPAQASQPEQSSHNSVVNGESVPPGPTVYGTPGNDTIECENDVENVIIWGGGGDDNIRVKGLVIDSQILGGDGDDRLQTSHLFPQEGTSSIKGGHGDQGDDEITVGSVQGSPGQFARGGGQVFGNDGSDIIRTGVIDFGGRVLGGSENDLIEAKGVGVEAGGVIQGGPGRDIIRGTDDSVLLAGPGWGMVDGGLGEDTCKVEHANPSRARSTIASCP